MKIRCPTGEERTLEECKACSKCFPKPIHHALLERRTPKRQSKPTFGVTQLTSNCLRQSYYKLTEEEIFDLEKLWIFSRGQAIHSFVTRTLKESEREIFVKREFPKFDIIGFIDALHEGILYEFKTTANIPESPQDHHILQGQAYYSLLDPLRQNPIKKIIIVYLSMQKIKQFEIVPRNILPWLKSRAETLYRAIKERRPPARQKSWLCKHCSFSKICEM